MTDNKDTTTEATVKKPRESKKNLLTSDVVNALTAGLPQYEKTSFLMVGHRNGVRLALPKTTSIGRVYFYADGDYSLIPNDDAIIVYTEEQRKELRKGGIMAEVNFDLGVEAALRAFTKLVNVVKASAAPVAKTVKPKAPKKEKALAAPKATKNVDDDSSNQEAVSEHSDSEQLEA